MGIFDASAGNGGSVNSATSWMQTDATSARAWSEQQAAIAFERQKELQKMAQDFNALEAQKARDFNSAEAAVARNFNSGEAKAVRDWQTEMANSIYTRSVKNMREAGINPILAANMGLSGANVGSGATASIGAASGSSASVGAGSAPLAQNFMDSSSASESSGQSWNHSESGLATAITAMAGLLSSALGSINSGMNFSLNLGDMEKNAKLVDQIFDDTKSGQSGKWKDYTDMIQGNYNKVRNGVTDLLSLYQKQAINNAIENHK